MKIDETKIVSSIDQIQEVIAQQGREQQTVAIIYAKSTDGPFWRETEPYEIKNDKYYGYDVQKDDHIRCFTLEDIIKACPLPNGFVPRWEVKF